MFLLRVLGLLAAIALGTSVLAYFVTGERRYLRLAWQIFKYSVFLSVLALLLIFGERLLAVA